MLYELRTYYIVPGRMDAIHRRFANHSLGILARMGMKTLDFWQSTEDNVLYYVLEHPDRASAERAWANFKEDPEWKEVKRLSELDGPIVERVDSVFMTRVPYSPVKG